MFLSEFREFMCSRSSERNINTIEVLFKMKIKSMKIKSLASLARVQYLYMYLRFSEYPFTILTLSLCCIEYLAYAQFVVMK